MCCRAVSPQYVLLLIIVSISADVFPAIIMSLISLYFNDFGHTTKLNFLSTFLSYDLLFLDYEVHCQISLCIVEVVNLYLRQHLQVRQHYLKINYQ